MKKSELKEIVKEALVEILPEVLMLMNEQLQENVSRQTSLVEVSEPDLDLIRSKFRQAQDVNGVSEFYGDSLSPSPMRGSARGVPKNETGVVNGEHFASGKGILEWFAKQGGKSPTQHSEFKHTDKQMNDFIAKKFGV